MKKRIFDIPYKEIVISDKDEVTVKVSLSDLLKEKWFLDYISEVAKNWKPKKENRNEYK